MEKEITEDIKRTILALYWGQSVIYYNEEKPFITRGLKLPDSVRESTLAWPKYKYAYLKLKSMSYIAEKDAVEFYESEMFPNYHRKAPDEQLIEWGNSIDDIPKIKADCVRDCISCIWQDLPLFVSDFFRSKGYALPYLNYSVDDLVNAGVYKLIK